MLRNKAYLCFDFASEQFKGNRLSAASSPLLFSNVLKAQST